MEFSVYSKINWRCVPESRAAYLSLAALLPCVINIPKGILRFLQQCGYLCNSLATVSRCWCFYTSWVALRWEKFATPSTMMWKAHTRRKKFFQTRKVFKKCHKIFTLPRVFAVCNSFFRKILIVQFEGLSASLELLPVRYAFRGDVCVRIRPFQLECFREVGKFWTKVVSASKQGFRRKGILIFDRRTGSCFTTQWSILQDWETKVFQLRQWCFGTNQQFYIIVHLKTFP